MTPLEGDVVVPPSTGWVESADVVYPARLPDGPPLVIEGSGVLVWHAALAGGSVADVVRRVADEAGVAVEEVEPGVHAFLAELVAAGVVEVARSAW